MTDLRDFGCETCVANGPECEPGCFYCDTRFRYDWTTGRYVEAHTAECPYSQTPDRRPVVADPASGYSPAAGDLPDSWLLALRYIAQPTMGFPGTEGGPWEDLTPPAMPDPEWWVRNGYGTESNIRLALATCIGMARAALRDAGE